MSRILSTTALDPVDNKWYHTTFAPDGSVTSRTEVPEPGPPPEPPAEPVPNPNLRDPLPKVRL